ncbi:MAG: hypothetical protein U0470_03920 [Anaerolineae bacterium]
MGVAAGDIDNDGWIDLLLTAFGGGDTSCATPARASRTSRRAPA